MLRIEEHTRKGAKTPTVKVHYDNIPDLLQYFEEFKERDGGSTKPPDKSWDMGAGWEGALKLAKTGWKQGTAEIMSKVKEIKNMDCSEKGGFMWDVTGEILDIGSFCAGDPEHWLQPMDIDTQPVYRICVNICCSCNVTAKQFANRGAAVIALVDKLQESGGIVELDVVMVDESPEGYGHDKSRSIESLELWHHFGASPLDVDMASFAIGHPAYFRRLSFAAIEVATRATTGCGGYGHVSDLPQAEAEKYDVYLYGGFSRSGNGIEEFNTIEGAAEWVNRTAEKVVAKHAGGAE